MLFVKTRRIRNPGVPIIPSGGKIDSHRHGRRRPAIHVFGAARKTWMPGTSPGMTGWEGQFLHRLVLAGYNPLGIERLIELVLFIYHVTSSCRHVLLNE
jgi:hypothetical protein